MRESRPLFSPRACAVASSSKRLPAVFQASKSPARGGWVRVVMAVVTFALLSGITTCHTSDCPAVDVDGNPIVAPCLQCSVPGSVPCMDNVWYLAEGSTCLEEQRPAKEDGTACDDGAGVCQAGVCESNAFPCTEQGIRNAIAAGGGPHVFDCAGPTIVPTTAEIVIDNDIALNGEGKLTLDAAGAHQVIRVQPGVTAELRGIAILGGGSVDYGGGIHNSGTLTVADATLTFNNATLHGGAIYTGVGDTLVLDNVIVENNGATRGGAVYVQQGDAVIYNSRFANNFATEKGGAIYTSFSSSLTLTDSQVLSNQLNTSAGVRGTGGGISSGGTLALHNSTVSGNDAGLDGSGGGIYSEEDVVLDGSTVSDNVTSGSLGIGGGMFIGGSSQTTMTRSTLSGNAAGSNGAGAAVIGGAITISESTISDNRNLGNAWGSGLLLDSALGTFTNSTFSGNNGPGVGAIALGAATIAMQNCTVSGNSMAYGGGIYAAWASDVTLVHTTMSGNTATASGGAIYLSDADSMVTVQNTILDGDCDGAGTMQSAGYNIESPADTCNFTEPTDRFNTASWALLLQSIQDNGGSTLTMKPRAGSVAIDVIPPQNCVGVDGLPLAEDQRGITRPQGTSCDIGAVEFDETIGSTWPTGTPEEQGFDSDQLASLVEWIDLNDRPIDSLLLVRNGVLILDAYFYPYFGDPPHDVASVTKSVTSTVTGIAIAQGILAGVDEKVMPLFPEAPAVGGKEDIEVGHLLTMSSGLACGEGDIFPMMASGNWVEYILDRPMAYAPGTTFHYCSPCAHLLSATITRAGGQTADEIAQQHLFGPLGIVTANWPTDPQGNSRGGGDLQLHPHDMARIGHLFLNDGMWNGQNVISSDWIAEATGPSPLTLSYGYLWWRFSEGFEAVGRGGQSILVRPADRLVVVLTGRGSSGSDEVMPTVMAALQLDEPLPPNGVAHDRLTTAIAHATLPPPAQPVLPLPDIAGEISGLDYQLAPNQYGVECYSLHFNINSPSDAVLSVVLPDGSYDLPIGMDGVPRFSAEEPGGFPVGIVGSWTTPTKFVADYDQLGGSTYLRVESEFGSDVDSVQLLWVDKTGYFGSQNVQGTRVDTCQ